MSAPVPSEIAPPVWLFMSACIAYDASTQVTMECKLSAPSVRVWSRVPCRYSSSLRSLDQSCSVGLETRVHRNAIVGWVSVLPRWETYSSFATTWWNVSVSLRVSVRDVRLCHIGPCVLVWLRAS
jgi:hypothetical protein